MTAVELIVGLKVPDNTAITAFNTLQNIGYKQLKKLEKCDYYKFHITEDADKFRERISKTDILINANKHKFSFSIGNNQDTGENYKKVNILVQELDNPEALLTTLRERLGFNEITKLEKGILWALSFDKNADAKNTAKDIAKNLLMNENYQKFKVIE
ncbi:MAG: hypothetical protein QF436_02440 [Candidatus Woesearchaeota archaeon]|nr:hypothetical protein [Candidatus Woesearchaeota archaeon]MDP7263355.1 hypothetical protein [Candidatus Woesearchaeota archaeon]MDP7622950.1 hypothetical protein [Candidatus Woesearchaeota archaeon]HJN57111.1 hypothetical protein [Candidatus Woesearchaeota archaeon]